MNQPSTKYQSYVLRLWQDSPHLLWHASIQSVQTSDILHFADIDALFHFLWEQITITHSADSIQSDKEGKK